MGPVFVVFCLLPDGDGDWLDPEVELGALVRGSLSLDKASVERTAAAMASAGRPAAIVEIMPRHGRRIVAVVGDEAPPMGRSR